MFKTRIRKIIGDVRARKGRTALVSIAIFIGVIGTIALFSMGDILVSQLREDLKEDELAMLRVFVTVNTGEELENEAYIERLERVPGVTAVMGQVGPLFGQFKLNPDDEGFENGELYSYVTPYEEGLPIEPIRLLEGGRYPNTEANEIAVEQRMAERYGLAIGDQLYLRILSPSRDESLGGEIGTLEAWTITGLVFNPYVVQGNPRASIYTAFGDANYIGGTTGITALIARFVDFPTAQRQSSEFADVVANETPYIPVFTSEENPEQNALITSAQQLSGTMGFLALVALIVSGFLVINVISSIVVEQKRQIGVMKSIGASRADNFFIYSGIAFCYGLLGVIPGVILGVPAGSAAAQALAPSLNTVIEGFRISPPSIILGVLVGLLVPVLAALIPVYNGSRVKILDAMTDLGIDARYGSGPMARFIALLPIPITVRQGLSNVSLKKSRLAFTVITLSIAAGAFMGIFAVFSTFTSGINIFFDLFNVEVGIFPNEAQDPDRMFTLLEENFQSSENAVIERIEPGFQFQVEFEGYEPAFSSFGPPGVFAYGYDVESDQPAFNVTIDQGAPLSAETADTGVIFSSVLASNMGKSIGDMVVMRVPGNSAELQIVAISEYPLDQVWMDWQALARIAGYTIGAPRPNNYFTSLVVEGYDSTSPDGEVAALGLDTQFSGMIPFTSGGFFTPGEPGVIISQAMAENGGFEVGDTITLNATDASGGSAEVPIVGIFQLPPLMQSEEIPDDLIGMDWQQLASLEGLTMDGKPVPQGYWMISTYENPTEEQLADILEEMDAVLLENGITYFGLNFVELANQIAEGFQIFQIILQAVALLIALVGGLGLLTTLSMSVFERQKEIGVMRSIGAGSGTVATQFLTEGLVVGIIAWLVGLPLAYLIEVGLLNVIGADEVFAAEFPVQAAVIGLVGMLTITMIASLWPSLSAARKTVSDILRYQ